MNLVFPKEPIAWNNYVEKLLTELQVDFTRLFQVTSQIPDPEIGIPFTGPLVPTPFCFPWQQCAVGSGGSGSPQTGGSASPVVSGTIPIYSGPPDYPRSGTEGLCSACSPCWEFDMFGVPWDALNGHWTVETADPSLCAWASPVTHSGAGTLWTWELVMAGLNIFTLTGYELNVPGVGGLRIIYQSAATPCPTSQIIMEVVWVKGDDPGAGPSGTGWPWNFPRTLTLTAC